MGDSTLTADAESAPRSSLAEEYLHETGFYESDEEFGELICPFAVGGLEAGEPVIFAYDEHKVGLLQEWLPDSPGISYVTDAGPYATPTKALASWRKLVERHLAAGARRVRIAGNVPHPGYGRSYVGWDRYEAAIDRALGDLPVWAPCLYDARIAPSEVLHSALRSHHHVLERSGAHRANAAYHADKRLADFLSPEPDPLEQTPPSIRLTDPAPGRVRHALRDVASVALAPETVVELVLAASEVVANALRHGVPPVTVQAWRGAGRVVLAVHDQGEGPADPLVGFFSSTDPSGASGRGLWLAHQLDLEVGLSVGDGFTVRIAAGPKA